MPTTESPCQPCVSSLFGCAFFKGSPTQHLWLRSTLKGKILGPFLCCRHHCLNKVSSSDLLNLLRVKFHLSRFLILAFNGDRGELGGWGGVNKTEANKSKELNELISFINPKERFGSGTFQCWSYLCFLDGMFFAWFKVSMAEMKLKVSV